jgi:hypothetical protein
MELRENNRVIYYCVTPPTSLRDILDTYPANEALRDQYPHTIHTILNLADIRLLPTDILAVRHSSPSLKHPRSGISVTVTKSAFVVSIAEILARLTGTGRIRIVRTEAEAWAIVQSVIANERGEANNGK